MRTKTSRRTAPERVRRQKKECQPHHVLVIRGHPKPMKARLLPEGCHQASDLSLTTCFLTSLPWCDCLLRFGNRDSGIDGCD